MKSLFEKTIMRYNKQVMKKSDLKVIRGGALAASLPDEQFIDAYATDTRLMGIVVIYIKWELSGLAAIGKKSRILHQFFYIETSEEGIESYRGIYGDDEEELRFAAQTMLGGLGGKRVPLTMNEAVFLVQRYAEMTRGFGKLLPDETNEYEFVLRREPGLGAEREQALFGKLCGKIDSPNQMINYFLMRYYAKDFFAARMLASSEIDCEQLSNVGPATLCRNEISRQEDGKYVCESVIEDDFGHRIIVVEVGVAQADDGGLAIDSIEVHSNFSISPAEAAMKLARAEYVTVFEIAGKVENVLYELDGRYAGAMQNLCEGGKLYIVFNNNNRHMNNDVYLLNDDVKEILFVTVEDQLIVASYTLAGIRRLENRMLLSRIAKQLVEVAKYEFKEPILYDYTLSYGGDFVRYVEDLMGFDDDD